MLAPLFEASVQRLEGGKMNKEIQSVLRFGTLLPVVVAGLSFSSTAVAQEETPIFEEIVVTVQRREQSLMDVPVAVSAISGAQIEAAGIKDMFDLQQNVVGLIVGQSQTSTSTNFSIRGVGSTANNFGVESSVGMYVDGVYRSRQSSLVNDLADIETVEVARGPQGTLFGKNTASGAIIIRTRQPSQDKEAFIDVSAGDYGLFRVSAGSNFSLSDNVAMRATFFGSQRDGYVDDAVRGSDFYNDRDRWGGRLQLGVNEPGDDFNMRIIADYAEIDEVCCAAISQVDGLVSQASLPTGIPEFGSDAVIMAFGGTIYTDFPYPPGFFPPNVVTDTGFEDYLVSYDEVPNSTNEDAGLSVEFNKGLGDSTTLTSITAYRTFDTFDTIDADFTNIPLISRTNEAEIESFSQELRLAGEFGEGSNYVVGAYYFAQEIDQVTFTGDASGQLGLLGTYLDAVEPDLVDAVTLVNTVNGLVGPPYPPAGIAFPAGVNSTDLVTQDQDGWAVFGQVDWALSDKFTVTLGARYTDETKKIKAVYDQTAQGPAIDIDALTFIGCQLQGLCPGVPNFADPATVAIFLPFGANAWGMYEFPPFSPRPDLDDQLSDDQTTGTVKLTWFPSDSTMLYASWSTGFKSGGTNTERISQAFDPIFGAETSESIEIGLKGQYGPVQLTVAVYDVEYDDFQEQTFTGTGFNLQNAGKLSTSGIELEMLWRPTDSTEIQAHYSHNEGEYDEYLAGTCWDTYLFHAGPDVSDPGSGGDPDAEVCDRTGFEIPYNPEDRAFLALTQDIQLGTNTSMFIRGEYSYMSSQFTDGDLDPFTKQDSFEIVNLRLGFNFERINSNLTVWGRNITDERYFHGSFDQPIGLGRMNSYPAEPATYGVTFRKNFD
jgi:outer membrane receptor protein involved in Fe transport